MFKDGVLCLAKNIEENANVFAISKFRWNKHEQNMDNIYTMVCVY